MPSVQELQQRAIDFAKSGDFGPQALSTNLELAKLAPANEGALTRLSRCYLESGQPAEHDREKPAGRGHQAPRRIDAGRQTRPRAHDEHGCPGR